MSGECGDAEGNFFFHLFFQFCLDTCVCLNETVVARPRRTERREKEISRKKKKGRIEENLDTRMAFGK